MLFLGVRSPLLRTLVPDRRGLLVRRDVLAGAARLLAKKAKAGGKAAAGKPGKGAKASDKVEDQDAEAEVVDLETLSLTMKKSIEYMKRELAGMQVGRATPTMLDALQVSVAGDKLPLPSLAKVLVQGSNALQLSVYDGVNTPAICKAIEMSGLNLMPEAIGKTIRVPVPRPTQEMRAMITKQVKKMGEKCRNQLRSHRQAAMKEAKAHPSKEVVRRQEKDVQKLHDDFVTQVDASVEAKEKEIASL